MFDRKNSLLAMGNSPLRKLGKLKRSESIGDPPPQVSDLVIEKSKQDFKPDSSVNLRERAIVKYKI